MENEFENIVELTKMCADKDRQIKELESKFAEKEKEIKEISGYYYDLLKCLEQRKEMQFKAERKLKV